MKKTIASYALEAEDTVPSHLSGNWEDVLYCLIEQGPCPVVDHAEDSGLASLLTEGCAVAVVNKGQLGYLAATYKGRVLYCRTVIGDET